MLSQDLKKKKKFYNQIMINGYYTKSFLSITSLRHGAINEYADDNELLVLPNDARLGDCLPLQLVQVGLAVISILSPSHSSPLLSYLSPPLSLSQSVK